MQNRPGLPNNLNVIRIKFTIKSYPLTKEVPNSTIDWLNINLVCRRRNKCPLCNSNINDGRPCGTELIQAILSILCQSSGKKTPTDTLLLAFAISYLT